MDQLKTLIQDLINDRKEQALATVHTYFVQKVQGMNESSIVKKLKLKINPDMTDAQIWDWIEQQEIMTIEDFDKQGDVLYITPSWGHKESNTDDEHLKFQKKLQSDLQGFDPEAEHENDEDHGEAMSDDERDPFAGPKHNGYNDKGEPVNVKSKGITASEPPGNKTSHI